MSAFKEINYMQTIKMLSNNFQIFTIFLIIFVGFIFLNIYYDFILHTLTF